MLQVAESHVFWAKEVGVWVEENWDAGATNRKGYTTQKPCAKQKQAETANGGLLILLVTFLVVKAF